MLNRRNQPPWQTDGKFFRAGSQRVVMRAVTYGPFPPGRPPAYEVDFAQIARAGFNAVRLYAMPGPDLLDAAQRHGLRVWAGLAWGQTSDFVHHPRLLTAARVALVGALKELGRHPALAGVYVANEVPADLLRWMGPLRVRHALEELIDCGHRHAPDKLFAYANYPSTEYLELENADFTAFNVYLEDPEALRRYCKRLHHLAGDRPLVISEFGLDSRRNGPQAQADLLESACRIARDEDLAGMTIYSWSDCWWNRSAEVLDWDFGLVDRAGMAKPALAAVAAVAPEPVWNDAETDTISVIVCTRNGRHRIGRCLDAIRRAADPGTEVIVVDDGSVDDTANLVAARFPDFRLLKLAACGLSAARNAGVAASQGQWLAFTDDDCEPDCEWLLRLRREFEKGRFAAIGGPNLPPAPRNWREAVVQAAPGAPSHVMIDDEEAEHLPGCNLALTREAFDQVGGFDPQFHTAGDDVDLCWRLRAAGIQLGFCPGAFVWHHRRPSIRGYITQQLGYGRAERILMHKHPEHFSEQGGARWQGFVYAGGPVRVMPDSSIGYGMMGDAPYQSVLNRMIPTRGLATHFDHWKTRGILALLKWAVPQMRAWVRTGGANQWPGVIRLSAWRGALRKCAAHERESQRMASFHERVIAVDITGGTRESLLQQLMTDYWHPAALNAPWDLEKRGARLLVATSREADGRDFFLLRIWGDPSLLRWPLAEDARAPISILRRSRPREGPTELASPPPALPAAPVELPTGPTWKERIEEAERSAGGGDSPRAIGPIWWKLAGWPLIPTAGLIAASIGLLRNMDVNGPAWLVGHAHLDPVQVAVRLPWVIAGLYGVYLLGLFWAWLWVTQRKRK